MIEMVEHELAFEINVMSYFNETYSPLVFCGFDSVLDLARRPWTVVIKFL